MSALSNESTAFVGLGDELDVLMGLEPSLDIKVLGGIASGWQMLTGTDGTDNWGIIMIRVFSGSGTRGGMAGGSIASWSHALALATVAACSLSFCQLWEYSAKLVCLHRSSL